MALPGLGPLPPAGASESASASVTSSPGIVPSGAGYTAASEDPNRKIRKPYTITKSRESWTEQEHDKFLEALQLFDRDWKKIEAFVGSKTVIQIRSHAQKYFLKVQKNGTSEHVPPPRPKRKAAHPYPQKASKNAPISHIMESFQSSPVLLEPGYVLRTDSSSVLGNSRVAVPSSQTYNQLPPIKMTNVVKDDNELAQPATANNYCGNSNSEGPRTWHSAMPDFAQVYRFIGSVFDPDASDHLQRLKMMDPINLKAAMMLMRNLSVNLTTPEFEDHRRLLSSYDVSSHRAKPRGIQNNFHAIKLENAISSA